MNQQRFNKAFTKFVKKVRDERIYATLGRGENFTDIVAPRKKHVWLTMPDGNTINLPNTGKGQVPLRAGLAVRLMRLATGELVIDGYDAGLMEDDDHLPDDYGNYPHPLGSHTDADFDPDTLADHQAVVRSGDGWINSAIDWTWLTGKPSTFPPSAHASSHQHGGSDEVATATATANAIPKAGAGGTLNNAWLATALAAIGALTPAADRLPYYTSSSAAALATLTAFARTLLDDTTQGAMQTTLGLVPGTNVQAQDARLQAIAGLTLAANKSIYWTGATAAATYDLTAFARTWAALADAAAGRTNLGLIAGGAGDIWVEKNGDTLSGDLDMGTHFIVNLADPSGAQDAATKAYVDAVLQGLTIKAAVRVATTANITLSGTQTIDGVALIAGDRVLVKDQSTGANNGIYVVAAGAWSRAADANASSEVQPGLYVFASEGTANGNNGYVLTTDAPITLGTTALTFTQFSGAGQIIDGAGLTKTGNTLAVNVDNSTIEIVSDILQAKDGGISNAKLATMAQATIKGRAAGAGTGAATDLTAAQVNAILANVLANGSVALTADWDIGASRKISGDKFAARSASGMRLEDDGGNPGLIVHDGGDVESGGAGTYTQGDFYIDLANKMIYVGRQSATSGNGSGFAIRDRIAGVYFSYDPAATGSQLNIAIPVAALAVVGNGTAAAKLHVLAANTTGEALRVERNLTATSTDSPVANVIQDHASDDQTALRVQQDGTGAILDLYDGATNVVKVADGGLVTFSTTKRVSSQFDKTNNTLADVTGLSIALPASGNFCFRAKLFVRTAAVAGVGAKVGVAYSGTTSTLRAFGQQTHAATTSVGNSYVTAVGVMNTSGGSGAGTDEFFWIEGYLVSTGAGNLTIQFAQNTTNASASSVLTGSTLEVWQLT